MVHMTYVKGVRECQLLLFNHFLQSMKDFFLLFSLEFPIRMGWIGQKRYAGIVFALFPYKQNICILFDYIVCRRNGVPLRKLRVKQPRESP